MANAAVLGRFDSRIPLQRREEVIVAPIQLTTL
jgi:hypothetical protein